MTDIIELLLQFIESLGYFGIFIMTLVESSFVPIPAEITMIPAGYLVYLGKMSFWGTYIASVSGSVVGGYLNYWIAKKYGRGLVLKYSKLLMISDKKLEKIESYFREHGAISVFTGRLLPAAKHYIGFPAGLAKMDAKKYLFYCFLSGAIWMGVLLGIGYFIGDNKDLIHKYVLYFKLLLLLLVIVVAAVYVIKNKKAKVEATKPTN